MLRFNHFLAIQDGICAPGGERPNEDTFGWVPEAAWVLDGVTGIEPIKIDGEPAPRWFAQCFSNALSTHLLQRPEADTLSLINHSIEDCVSIWEARGLPNSIHPAATFAMVRLMPDHVELSTIGDCSIRFASDEGNVKVFGDRSVEPFENRTLQRLAKVRTEHPSMPHSELVVLVNETRASNRHYLNKADGYNALTLSEILPRNLISQKLDVRLEQDLLLTTDGFSRYSDVLNIGTDDALFFAKADGLDRLLQSIRSAERADAECRQFPRMKRSDDATSLWVRIKPSH